MPLSITEGDTPIEGVELVSLPRAERLPKNSWTDFQRFVLIFLYKRFRNPTRELTAIFNALFRKQLMKRGLQDGISHSTFTAQLHDMRSRGHPYWESVYLDNSLWNRNVAGIQENIQLTAQRLAIPLQIRVMNDIVHQRHGYRKKLKSNARDVLSLLDSRSSALNLNNDPRSEQIAKQMTATLEPMVFPTSPNEQHREDREVDPNARFTIPRLAYRW